MTAKLSPADQLDLTIRAKYPVILIESYEETRVHAVVEQVAKQNRKSLFVWTCSQGLRRVLGSATTKDPAADETQEPNAALRAVHGWGTDRPCIFLFKDLHGFAQDPQVLRWIRDIAGAFQEQPNTLIMLSPQFTSANSLPGNGGLPADLEKEIAIIDWPLPVNGELAAILDECANTVRGQQTRDGGRVTVSLDNGSREGILRAMQGLTAFEANSVLSLAVVTHKALDERAIPLIVAEKKQIVKKTGYLEFWDAGYTLADVGGLDLLKAYVQEQAAIMSAEARAYGLPAPRGLLEVGVPGGGKSLLAKVIASLMSAPLLRLDIGTLFGSLVGQSQANTRAALKLADAIAPCVLWVDEIEKGMAGMVGGGENDGGTAKQVFGTLLTWMQEHTTPVYVVATANDVRGLAPELLSRFDDIFFVDMPSELERAEIINIHLKKYGRPTDIYDVKAVASCTFDFVGREIDKVVRTALRAAFIDGAREVTTGDLLRAAEQIIPISRTMKDKITELRDWAENKARPASSSQDNPLSEPERSESSRGRALEV